MNCQRYRKWLIDSAADALNTRREAKLRAHLAECSECRAQFERELKLLDAIDRTITRTLAAEPNPDLLARVRESIDELGSTELLSSSAARNYSRMNSRRVSEKRNSALPRWPDFHAKGWIAVAAACALAIGIASVILVRSRSSAPSTATMVAARQISPIASEERVNLSPPPPPKASPRHARRELAHVRRETRILRKPRLRERRVIVEPDEAALVNELIAGFKTGRIDAASLLAPPPGFKREPDGSLTAAPLKIKPIEIAALNAGATATGARKVQGRP